MLVATLDLPPEATRPMPSLPPRPPLTVSIRLLMVAVAVVAISMRWSAHWFDCKQQAAIHASLAGRPFVGQAAATNPTGPRRTLEEEWHEEMSRRFERAAWLPWPFPPEPPRP